MILISLTQSGYQIYSSLDQQVAKATLQSEALQALQMMGDAIHMASASKGSTIPRLMVKDTASMSNTQAGQFQVEKVLRAWMAQMLSLRLINKKI